MYEEAPGFRPGPREATIEKCDEPLPNLALIFDLRPSTSAASYGPMMSGLMMLSLGMQARPARIHPHYLLIAYPMLPLFYHNLPLIYPIQPHCTTILPPYYPHFTPIQPTDESLVPPHTRVSVSLFLFLEPSCYPRLVLITPNLLPITPMYPHFTPTLTPMC